MAERRGPPPAPQGSPPSLEHMWRELLALWRYVRAGYDGLPAPHIHVDGSGAVADPSTAGGGADRMTVYFHMGA